MFWVERDLNDHLIRIHFLHVQKLVYVDKALVSNIGFFLFSNINLRTYVHALNIFVA